MQQAGSSNRPATRVFRPVVPNQTCLSSAIQSSLRALRPAPSPANANHTLDSSSASQSAPELLHSDEHRLPAPMVDFEKIRFCKRANGEDWLLGSGSFGMVSARLRPLEPFPAPAIAHCCLCLPAYSLPDLVVSMYLGRTCMPATTCTMPMAPMPAVPVFAPCPPCLPLPACPLPSPAYSLPALFPGLHIVCLAPAACPLWHLLPIAHLPLSALCCVCCLLLACPLWPMVSTACLLTEASG